MIIKFLMHISFYITKLECEVIGFYPMRNWEKEGGWSSMFLLIHDCLFFTGVGLIMSLPMKKIISSYMDLFNYSFIIFLIASTIEWALSSYMFRNHKYALYYPEFEKQHENAKIKDSFRWIFLILLYMLVSIGTFVIGCVLIAR